MQQAPDRKKPPRSPQFVLLMESTRADADHSVAESNRRSNCQCEELNGLLEIMADDFKMFEEEKTAFENLQKDIAVKLHKHIGDLKDMAFRLQEDFVLERHALNDQIKKSEANKDEAVEEIKKLKQQLLELETKNIIMERRIHHERSRSVERLMEENEKCNKENAELLKKISCMKIELDILKEETKSQNDYKSENKQLSSERVEDSGTAPAKRPRGRPLGSKNKGKKKMPERQIRIDPEELSKTILRNVNI